MTPTVIVHPDGPTLDVAVANLVAARLGETLRQRPAATFIGSAGRTPTGIYAHLRTALGSALDWSRVTVVQMDDYLLPPTAPGSLAAELAAELVHPLRIGRFITFNDESGRPARPVTEHDQLARGADLILHGIGRNGHLGFNEPPSLPDSASGVRTLVSATTQDNGVDHAQGVTLGLDCLLSAHCSIVVAKGAAKAAAVAGMLAPEPDPACPASWIRLTDAQIHLDPAAATALPSAAG